MRLFLAEDEQPARERLAETLARVAPDAAIVGMAGSVGDAVQWLETHPAPDLLLLDVQLSDGLSFELFARTSVSCPAVFAMAYDEFMLEAFRAHAIDYVLKPVSDAAMARALGNYRRLREHFSADAVRGLAELSLPPGANRQRQRLLARHGTGYLSLRFEQIAYFASLDKLTFAVDFDGRRHLVESTLAELETRLDPTEFFRISRQMIVSAASVVGFHAAGRGRLTIDLRPACQETVSMTQDRAAAFRQWMDT